MIIQYQLKSYVEKLISNNQDGNIDLFLSLYFEISKKINLFNSLNLDKNQLISIIKYSFLEYSKKYK